jgi:hypothetical protein
MDTNEKILEQLIANNRRAILVQSFVALLLFIVGAGVLVYTFKSGGEFKDIPTVVTSVAGVFTSSLSAFPIKEILTRSEKTGVFQTIRSRYRSVSKSKNAATREERKRLDQLMSQIVEKAALG